LFLQISFEPDEMRIMVDGIQLESVPYPDRKDVQLMHGMYSAWSILQGVDFDIQRRNILEQSLKHLEI
jgi:hypothetical protein